jgi:hypothetical protein
VNALVTRYVVSRGVQVAAVVLLGVLCVAALGRIPTTPAGIVLRLALLLGGLLWAFRTLHTPTLAFFLGTLLALLLFHKPLDLYVHKLAGQARSLIVFLIVLFGGTLAVVSRQDLLDALPPATATRHSSEQTRLYHAVAVFCLLQRFAIWIQRSRLSLFLRGGLVFLLVLANFVSSGPAVLFFKSLWASPTADFRMHEADRALAAGILCLCTSGALLLYTGEGQFMSPWWLFYTEVAEPRCLPPWPVAGYLYGLLSFVHGVWLIFGRSRTAGVMDQMSAADVAVRRLQGLYLVVLLICLGATALVFVGRTQGQPAQPAVAPQPAAVRTTCLRDKPVSQAEQEEAKRLEENRNKQLLTVSTVFLGLLLATLLAQGLMYSFFMRPAADVWQPSAFWTLMLYGMRGVFGTVVTLVVILAFKDILTEVMQPLKAQPLTPQALLETPWGRGLVLGVVFALTFAIGRLIGTAWGTFTIGLMLFTISGVDVTPVTTVVEALILLGIWINQSTLNADNVQIMLGTGHATRDTLRAVWSVPTFPQYPSCQAQYLQYAILGVSIGLALALRMLWPGVL